MKRIASLVFWLALAACSSVDQRELVPTSKFQQSSPGAGEPVPSIAADAVNSVDLSGDFIPAGTTLRFVVQDAVSSATAKIGDTFRLQSRTRVLLNGVEVLPSGVGAHGEVIHADRRGMLGKPKPWIPTIQKFPDPIPATRLVSVLSGKVGVPTASLLQGHLRSPLRLPRSSAKPLPSSWPKLDLTKRMSPLQKASF